MASFSSIVALTIFGCLFFVHVSDAKKYKVIDQKANWFKAFEICILEGKRLAAVITGVEQHVMEETYIKGAGHGEMDSIWLALTDLTAPGTYHWFTNAQSTSYYNWAAGMPTKEHCVSMTKAAQYKWTTDDCFAEKYVVCEF